MDFHATASKSWTQEDWQEITNDKVDIEKRFCSLVIEDGIDRVPFDSQEINNVMDVNKIDVRNNYFIPVKEWQRNINLEPPTTRNDFI